MSLKAEHENLKTLIVETVTLLCKNGLKFRKGFSVEGLLGITLDENDIFLVNIKETVKSALESIGSETTAVENRQSPISSSRHHRRRKKPQQRSSISHSATSDESDIDQSPHKRPLLDLKQEQDNVIVIKEERDSTDDVKRNIDSSLSENIRSETDPNYLDGQSFNEYMEAAYPTGNEHFDNSQFINQESYDPSTVLNPDDPSDGKAGLLSSQNSISNSPNEYCKFVDGKFICQICEESYASRRSLLRHVYTRHLGRRFPCQNCGRGFTRVGYLKDHYIKCVRSTSTNLSSSNISDKNSSTLRESHEVGGSSIITDKNNLLDYDFSLSDIVDNSQTSELNIG